MSTIKTAISMDETLYKHVEKARKRMKVSRSKFCAEAIRRFVENLESQRISDEINPVNGHRPDAKAGQSVERHKTGANQRILDKLNEVYGRNPPSPEEIQFLHNAASLQIRRREDDKW